MKYNFKEWLKAALIRAVRTFAEAMLAYIGTGAIVLKDVSWLAALSAGAVSTRNRNVMKRKEIWCRMSVMTREASKRATPGMRGEIMTVPKALACGA